MHKIWNGINELVNVKSKVLSSPCTIKSNGKTISDPKEIATSFNTYFTNIAEEIIRKRKYNGRINHMKYLTEPLDKTFVLYGGAQGVTEYENTNFYWAKSENPNVFLEKYENTKIIHIKYENSANFSAAQNRSECFQS